MGVTFLYTTRLGRGMLKLLNHTGLLKVGEWFVRKPVSRYLVEPYVKKHHIDMRDFAGREFESYADFFSRKKDHITFQTDPQVLISPCDSRLSVFEIDEDSVLKIKGFFYKIYDLIPNRTVADWFVGGSCFIFRLEASDYHHFCYIDDCYHEKCHFIPGLLHSVQPIACEKEPVYRVNRRNWSLLKTSHFGLVAQIEVGALLVGGICHDSPECYHKRGDEMGHFELAGSTVVLLFTKDASRRMSLLADYKDALGGIKEMKVRQGQAIGRIS